ncbi:oligoendopeptidase F [Domibacillus enclensis]|uniref:Oligopeptidase F n=1 Tax=Domibacillus enclensis TaxID=1017273 RepID=A0A1N7AVQ8_9BACI|nr:oligoendopeptidase F [Domibacillus enclensis]OXS75100.1 oligoendopeptidase F [Domibacillus enclensis]SIR43154.1 oligoendopeptidase F [Domibacillus enclensis]
MADSGVKQLPARSEVPEELKWRLEDIFSTDEEWETEFQSIQELAGEAASYNGTLGNSAEQMHAFFSWQDVLLERMGRLYTYAHMRYDEDTQNAHYQGMNDRAKMLYTQIAGALSFADPEILSIEEEKVNGFVASFEPLQLYKKVLDDLNKQRPHILSAAEENLLAQASDVLGSSSTTFGMLNNADLEFPVIKDENGENVQITHGNYVRFLESSDRRVREEAFKAVYATYGSFKNTFASTLSGQIKKDNFSAKVRHYNSAREAALSRNHIPEAVYDNLVGTINKNLPLLHRYVALRKKVLGLDELHMYDLYTPLVAEGKFDVTYEEAKDLLQKGLQPLGNEYNDILTKGLESRWVDVVENKGKRSGAYSSGAYGTNPYVLMNWQDNVNNLFTLAHEFGHSIHSYYTRENQPYIYGDYSIFVAEVASTCNESILNDYLLKTTDDEKKRIYLLNHFLETFRGTVFRQTMFAEFEHLVHEKAQNGEALTADGLSAAYYELNKKYFGDEMVIDEEIALEWARIPHFYYNYYVYQYATGLSAAIALSSQILEDGEPAANRYIHEFLKAGSSADPIEVLKRAGVDMTEADAIEAACRVFEESLEEMENLLG